MPCRVEAQRGRPAANQNKVSRPCAWCGEAVTRAASNFHSDKVFCDHRCMAEWQSEFMVGENHPRWMGGQARGGYGVGWRPLRRQALARSGGVCEACKKKPVDEVHHKIPIRCFETPSQANFASNLIALCKQCHVDAHKVINASLLSLLHYEDPSAIGTSD